MITRENLAFFAIQGLLKASQKSNLGDAKRAVQQDNGQREEIVLDSERTDENDEDAVSYFTFLVH